MDSIPLNRTIIEDWLIPRGQVYEFPPTRSILMHPSTAMMVRNNGQVPFYTRHMVGVHEAERDRRRHRR